MGAMFLLGMATGMRSMTPIAVVCWFAWSGRLHVQNTWAFWTANVISLAVFGVFAVGEWVGDTLPMTPNRTSFFPAAARVVFGALCGAVLASAYMEPVAGGLVFGAAGALVGTWGGFYLRRAVTRIVKHDLPIALLGSVLAALISIVSIRYYVEHMEKNPVRYRDATGQLRSPESLQTPAACRFIRA